MEQYQQNWKNYYEILQVSPNAEPEVIAAAYKRLDQLYHPDTAKKLNASAKMSDNNEAYEVLSNPNKRMEYQREFTSRQTSGVTGVNVENSVTKSSESHNSNARSYYEQEPIRAHSTQARDESVVIRSLRLVGIGITVTVAFIFFVFLVLSFDKKVNPEAVATGRLISGVALLILVSVLRKTWRK